MILNLSTPKDMRESIEVLAHCQVQTNESMAKIMEALQALTAWMKEKEKIEVETAKKLELIMKATTP